MNVEDLILADLPQRDWTKPRVTPGYAEELADAVRRGDEERQKTLALWSLVWSRPTAAERVRRGQPVEAVLAQIDAERDADDRRLEWGKKRPVEQPPDVEEALDLPDPVTAAFRARRKAL